MASVDAPEARACVEYFLVIDGREIHAFGTFQNTGGCLELFVGSKGHPEIFHVHFFGQADVFGNGVHGNLQLTSEYLTVTVLQK